MAPETRDGHFRKNCFPVSGNDIFCFSGKFFVFRNIFCFSGKFFVFRNIFCFPFSGKCSAFPLSGKYCFPFSEKIRFAEKFLFSFSRKIFFFPFYGKFCFPKKFPFSVLNFPENVATLNKFTENRNFNKFTESRSLNNTQNIGSV